MLHKNWMHENFIVNSKSVHNTKGIIEDRDTMMSTH